MADIPSDFQKQLKLYNSSGLESQYGKFTGTGKQQDALTDFVRGGGKSSGSSGALDYQKIIEQSIKSAQRANEPVIQSLQSSIPETQQRFEQERTRLGGEVEPLKQRYQSLLESIKGKEQTATERQTLATSRELGKRGILPSSGVAEQEMVNALNPITRDFAGLTQETGLAQEADLRAIQNAITGLTGQQTAEERAIQNAIAQLQSGAIQTGANTGISLSGLLQNQQQFNAGQELNKQIQALAERQFTESTLPQTQYAINAPYFKPETPNPAQNALNALIARIAERDGANSSSEKQFNSVLYD